MKEGIDEVDSGFHHQHTVADACPSATYTEYFTSLYFTSLHLTSFYFPHHIITLPSATFASLYYERTSHGSKIIT